MLLQGKEPTFRQPRMKSNPTRVLILCILLVSSLFLIKAMMEEDIQSPFMPTPTATRSVASFSLEADTHFKAGNLEEAISTYRRAAELQPDNAMLWYELARIQSYSSTLMTTDDDRRARMEEALASADKAVEIAPEDSSAHAVRAFVLDWYATPALVGERAGNLLTEGEQEAVRALQLDNQNTLALAYYAEILIDQQKWLQAEQYARQALERDPALMDVHRVMAYVQESLGNYGDAIREYKLAAEITPNMTFLYISIGGNYRILKQYDLALEYYAKAVTINEQLGIQDPIPHLAISKVYSQTGDFFIASLNVRKALQYNPTSPDIYGQLGIVYFKARNYEGAIPALKCAVRGCTADESCEVRRCDAAVDPQITIQGMPLTGNTVVYYYTYGSVLAGMHRPTNPVNYCEEALKVLEEVRAGFPAEPSILEIVQANEDICASFGIRR